MPFTAILAVALIGCGDDPGLSVWATSDYSEPVIMVVTGGQPGNTGVEVVAYRVEPGLALAQSGFVLLEGRTPGEVHVFDSQCHEIGKGSIEHLGDWMVAIQSDGSVEVTAFSDRGPTAAQDLPPGGTLCGVAPEQR